MQTKIVKNITLIIIIFLRIIKAESYSYLSILMQYYGNQTKLGAHIPFNFGLMRKVERNNLVETIDNTIKDWLYNIKENMVANGVVRFFNV